MNELPLDQVRTLLAVVDEGTFDAAAAALHVTPVGGQPAGQGPGAAHRPGAADAHQAGAADRLRRGRWSARPPARPAGAGRARRAGDERCRGADAGVDRGERGLARDLVPGRAHRGAADPVCFELRREDEAHTAALLREGAGDGGGDLLAGPGAGLLGAAAGADALPAGGGPGVRRAAAVRAARGSAGRAARDGLRPTRTTSRTPSYAGSAATGAGPLRHYVPTSEGFARGGGARARLGPGPGAAGGAAAGGGQARTAGTGPVVDVPLYWQQWKLDSPALAMVADAVTAAARRALRR